MENIRPEGRKELFSPKLICEMGPSEITSLSVRGGLCIFRSLQIVPVVGSYWVMVVVNLGVSNATRTIIYFALLLSILHLVHNLSTIDKVILNWLKFFYDAIFSPNGATFSCWHEFQISIVNQYLSFKKR